MASSKEYRRMNLEDNLEDSAESDNSMDHPPSFQDCEIFLFTLTDIYIYDLQECSSTNVITMSPTGVPSDASTNAFISVFDRNIPDIQALIKKLKELIDSLETIQRNTTIGSLSGGVLWAVGGITSIAGLILDPFTLGASLIVMGISIVFSQLLKV